MTPRSTYAYLVPSMANQEKGQHPLTRLGQPCERIIFLDRMPACFRNIPKS